MDRTRQSEAKSMLSSLYTAEKAFQAEYSTYSTRFGAIGFTPEGRVYYKVATAGASTFLSTTHMHRDSINATTSADSWRIHQNHLLTQVFPPN